MTRLMFMLLLMTGEQRTWKKMIKIMGMIVEYCGNLQTHNQDHQAAMNYCELL